MNLQLWHVVKSDRVAGDLLEASEAILSRSMRSLTKGASEVGSTPTCRSIALGTVRM